MGSTELQRFIDNKSLVAIRKFAAAEAQLKELKAKHDEVIEQVKQAMIDNNVTKIDGEWGSITLAERTTYGTGDIMQVSMDLTKRVLDPTKVKAQAVLTGSLPNGVTESKTQYIVKRLKDV